MTTSATAALDTLLDTANHIVRVASPTQRAILVEVETNGTTARRIARPTRDALIRIGAVEIGVTGALVLTDAGQQAAVQLVLDATTVGGKAAVDADLAALADEQAALDAQRDEPAPAPAAAADVIRTRADRAVAQLHAARDLLAAHDLDVVRLVNTITGRADRAIYYRLAAYEFAAIGGVAERIGRVSDRLTRTRVTGPRHRRTIETTSGGHPDGDRLANLVLNLQAIDTDRPDADLLTV